MIRRRWRGLVVCAGIALTMLLPAAGALAALPVPTPLPAVPGSESEPNDSPATASPIQSGERIRANLLAAGDVDYYRFSAQAGERVFANVVTAATAGGSTDSELTLLSSEGTTIEYDDNDGSQLAFASSIAGAKIPSDGVYYLKVKDFSSGAVTEVPYDLYFQLRSGAPQVESEPNDEPGEANPLVTGEVTGTHTANDRDWYSMQLQEGDTVFLSLDLEPGRTGETFNGRLGFGRAGDGGNQILTVDDPSEGEPPDSTPPSEALTMTVAKSGTYYAYVDSANAAAGTNYDLSATVIPAAQPSCRTYPSSLSGEFFDGGMLTYPIEVADLARIRRAAVRLNLEDSAMPDLDVSLRNPAGVELPIFTDIGSSSQEHLEALFDESAAVQPLYASLRPLGLQPERASRLGWLEGQQAQGTWNVVVRDDELNLSTGSVQAAELILCPEAEEPEGKPIFSAGFEAGEEGFVNNGANDQWERGTPNTVETNTNPPIAGLSACAQGVSCFKTDLTGPYAGSSSQNLFSPPISLAGRSGQILVSWEQWYQLEAVRSDRATVIVEEDGGGNPRTLFEWTGPTMTAQLGNNNYPVAAGWGLHKADISAYAGKTVRLRFRLTSDANGVNLAGLAIDDVRVYEPVRAAPSEGAFFNPAQQTKPPAPPVLSAFTIAPGKFRAAKQGPTVLAKRPKVGGALVSYQDSQAAQTNVVLFEVEPGRKVGGKCVPETKANATKKPCTRYVKVTSFVRYDVAGRNKFGFTGRVAARKLPTGEYRLQAKAYAPSGLTSAPVTANFTVLPQVSSK